MADYDRQGEEVAGEVRIYLDHFVRLCLRLLRSGVRGVAFLPEEFRGPEEEAGTHFPAHHVAPLVAEYREVPPGGDPVLVGVPDYGFGSRPYDELFLELRGRVHYHSLSVRVVHQTVMGDYGALFRKAGHVLGLAAEEGLRDEQREIGILHAALLEHSVEDALHFLPYRISVRFYHHTSPDRRLFCEVSLDYKVVVPLRVVFGPLGYFFCHFIICYCFFFCLYLRSWFRLDYCICEPAAH